MFLYPISIRLELLGNTLNSFVDWENLMDFHQTMARVDYYQDSYNALLVLQFSPA
jgi:hypothetical protein